MNKKVFVLLLVVVVVAGFVLGFATAKKVMQKTLLQHFPLLMLTMSLKLKILLTRVLKPIQKQKLLTRPKQRQLKQKKSLKVIL